MIELRSLAWRRRLLSARLRRNQPYSDRQTDQQQKDQYDKDEPHLGRRLHFSCFSFRPLCRLCATFPHDHDYLPVKSNLCLRKSREGNCHSAAHVGYCRKARSHIGNSMADASCFNKLEWLIVR